MAFEKARATRARNVEARKKLSVEQKEELKQQRKLEKAKALLASVPETKDDEPVPVPDEPAKQPDFDYDRLSTQVAQELWAKLEDSAQVPEAPPPPVPRKTRPKPRPAQKRRRPEPEYDSYQPLRANTIQFL